MVIFHSRTTEKMERILFLSVTGKLMQRLDVSKHLQFAWDAGFPQAAEPSLARSF